MRVKGNPIAMPLLWVLSLSLLFQTATFIYVFRELVLKRKVRWFGVCASIALFLMAIRRFLALEELRHDPSFASEMAFAEWLGLILSVLMLVGFWGIARHINRLQAFLEDLEGGPERFRSLFDISPVPVMLIGFERRILSCNKVLADTLGYQPDDLSGRPTDELTLKDDLSVGLPELERLRRGEIKVARYAKRYLRRDGGWVWFDGAVSLVRDKEGRPKCFLLIARDMTEQMRLQAALREKSDWFARVYDLSPVSVVILDYQRTFIDCNRAFEEFIGYSKDWILGKKIEAITYEEDQGISEDAYRQVGTAGEKGVMYQKRYRRQDGSLVWGDVMLAPLTEGAPEAVQYIAIIQDVTERKKAEEELRASMSRFKQIHDLLPVGVAMSSTNRILLRCNPAFAAILGRPMEEVVGHSEEEWTHPQDLAVGIEEIGRLLRHPDQTVTFQKRYRKDDGSVVWVDVIVKLMSEGMFQYFLHIARDVTERKMAEEALRENERFLRKAQQIARAGSARMDVVKGESVFSEELCDLLGLEKGRPVSVETFLGIVHPDDRGRIESFYRDKVLQGMRVFEDDYRVIRRTDGQTRWMHSTNEMEFDEVGNPRFLYGTLQDITERKHDEEKLRKNEERFRTIVENINDGFVIHDFRGVISDCNEVFCRLAGHEKRRMIGASLDLFVKPQQGRDPNEWIRVIREAGEASFNVFLTREDGRQVPVWVNAKLVDQGSEGRIQSFVRDMTEIQKKESELREAQYFLARAQEAARLGSYRLEVPTGKWRCSKSLFALFGIPEGSELSDETLARFIHPEDLQKLQQSRTEKMERGGEFKNEFRVRRPSDDQWRWLRNIGEAEYDATGNMIGKTGVIQDITDQKTVEEALKESETFLSRAQEVAHLGSYLIDLRTGQWRCSDEFYKIFGFPMGESIDAKKTIGATHPEDRERFLRRNEEGLRDLGPVDEECRVIRASDGETRWIHIIGEFEADEAGRPIRRIGVVQDVTDRKRAMEDLRNSEERFRLLAENIPLAVYESDLEGNFSYVNRMAIQMFGYSQEDLRSGIHLLKTVHPDDRAKARELMGLVRQGQSVEKGSEIRGLRKDGTVFPIMVYAAPRKKGGALVGSFGISMDLTELKRAMEERERLQMELFQAQKMESIGTLAGGIAHDFNNLLSAILGEISLVEAEVGEGHPVLEDLLEMKGQVKRGSELTRQLLGFAHRGKYDPKPLDLDEVLEKTLKMFARTRKDIATKAERSGGLLAVLADRTQLEQLLLNLLVNAGQAMPHGGSLLVRSSRAEVSTSEAAKRGVSPGSYAQFSVTDQGVGIAPEALEHIFEPFFTTKEPGRGTGLGLASVYGIVKNHKGYIEVESELGRGTTFTVFLPTTHEKPEIERPSEEKEVSPVMGGTILLVDDEESILKVSGRMLETLDFKVLKARSGKEALEIYRQRPAGVSLVILDMVMPGMSGLETYDALRAINSNVKVILASGYSVEGQATVVLEHGCNGFIPKPYGIDTLRAKIREVL
jgi:PAS domain S-box-containing protein